MTDSEGIRLNKFISDSGFCSRREADKLIEANRVSVNGCASELGVRVFPGDEVRVDDKRIHSSAANKTDRVYIAYQNPWVSPAQQKDIYMGILLIAIAHKNVFSRSVDWIRIQRA